MYKIDINCDMGEGYPDDALLMRYISSANIACGFHAGDAETMKRTVELCMHHNVAIGAHPSYPDPENFGRTDMLGKELQLADLPGIIAEQVHALLNICKKEGAKLHHVKPHGALYNRAARDREAAMLICKTVGEIDPSLILYGLSGSIMKEAAACFNLQFWNEVFADRTYQPDGSLTPRTEQGALIENTGHALRQVIRIVRHQQVTAIDGSQVNLVADTICIHGDGKHAVEFAGAIYEELVNNGIALQ
ncbi:MAG TPA: 5-oxoprolinase subunit PxpA [Chitinophagaceae bacterium]|nr:5-oxoprolinase subunit PxpA [Chitinophagaceae bacterium]